MKWQIHRHRVTQEYTGQRLDQFLPQVVADMSRTKVRKIVDLGGVHVNGRRMRTCSYLVKAADLVELYLDHLPLEPYRIAAADVVFQDNYLIVLNKPAHIDTQPTHARYKGTLYDALQCHLKDPFRPQQKPEIGMVQRLDRSTSGLIAFSIHPAAHKQMTKIFHEHLIEKLYLAVVSGVPEPRRGEVRSLLARSRNGNRVHTVSAGGKLAITRYTVKQVLTTSSLLSVQILTGRSHQIRAHMAEVGCPLLGDDRYGGDVELTGIRFERPLLHASQLEFDHPVTGKRLSFTAPMPDDMQKAITSLESE